MEVWQASRKLVRTVYEIFSSIHDFSFRDQITRASLSIMNNIAEGHERDSKKEFARFLKIAKGSCGEVRSMLLIAHCWCGFAIRTSANKAENYSI